MEPLLQAGRVPLALLKHPSPPPQTPPRPREGRFWAEGSSLLGQTQVCWASPHPLSPEEEVHRTRI